MVKIVIRYPRIEDHEVGHALGIRLLWASWALPQSTDSLITDSLITGFASFSLHKGRHEGAFWGRLSAGRVLHDNVPDSVH
jgi:hypothetical protein